MIEHRNTLCTPLLFGTAELLRERNIKAAFAHCKNKIFFETLLRAAEQDNGPWGIAERHFLAHTLQYKPDDWIMGRGIDTGVKKRVIEEYLKELHPDLLREPRVSDIFAGLDGWEFRRGSGGEGIIGLVPQDNRFQLYVAKSTEFLAKQLKAYVGK